MILGFTIFSLLIREEVADVKFWRYYIRRNIQKGIKILIALSNDLKCLVCSELSLNYQSKASLAKHYQFSHFYDTVNYILDHIITQDPNELQEKIDDD